MRNFLGDVLRGLGYERYEITCPGIILSTTGKKIDPHRAKVWARNEPKPGDRYCLNCLLLLGAPPEIRNPYI
ncbi:MAG: hypothetical protein GF368_04525 [Candidatus Aenigmarchaeota archaeon]|nr:hypothetical protein [Candidatus Aenigmarchaeota archaeon]